MRSAAHILALGALAALAPLRAGAQAQEEPYDPAVITLFDGLPVTAIDVYPDLGIAHPFAFAGVNEGAPLSQPLVHALIEKVWGTGKVATVAVYAHDDGGGGVRLEVRASPRIRVHSISFSGNKAIKSDELKEASGFRPDMELFGDSVEKIRALVLERYALRGFPAATCAVGKEKLDDAGKVKLVVTVVEGKAVRMWKLSFTGRPIFSAWKLRKITKLKGGDRYDQVKIGQGTGRLKAALKELGFYACAAGGPEVRLDGKGRLVVEIPVDPGPRFTVEVRGNDHLPTARIKELLDFSALPEVGGAYLEELSADLEKAYRARGFLAASVVGALQLAPGGEEGTILFVVTEGTRVFVEDILFSGNHHLPVKLLKNQVERILNEKIDYKVFFVEPSFDVMAGIGLGGSPKTPSFSTGKKAIETAPWKPARIYVKESFEEAAAYIKKLYASRGYLGAEVAEPALAFGPKGDAVTVTFVIKEGAGTWIKDIRFEGVKPARTADLLKALKVKKGKPFDGIAIKEGEGVILNWYADRGHRFATVDSRVEFLKDDREAVITYTVVEGPPVFVQEIDIRGNAVTKKSVILDRITLAPGGLFTLKQQNQSAAYLRDLGIFNSVVISMEEPSLETPQKRAVVLLTEKKQQFLELRAGASSAEGLRGGMEYGYRNLFGLGLQFGFMLSFNYRFFFVGTGPYFAEWYQNELDLAKQLERNIGVSFGVLHLPKVGRWLTIQTSFGHQRKNSNLYGITQNSVYLSFLVKPVHMLHMTLRAGFEDNDVGTNTVAERVLSTQIQELPPCSATLTKGCLNAEESRALRVPVGKTSFTVLGLDFSLDLRNSAFNPTSGARISGGVSWIRSTKHAEMEHRAWADNEAAKTWTTWAFSNLIRATLAVSAYIPLGTPKVVLMLYGGAGYVAQLQSGSETFADRLFYLGGGHTMRGFPEESLCAHESGAYDTPGKKVCIYGGNLMVNYKIELQLAVYRELGLVVFSDLGNLWREPKNFSPIDLRATVGVGIKYSTPIGPINLAYGFILLRDKERGEPLGSLHFSIGAI